MTRVFISHGKRDAELATSLRKTLAHLNVQTFDPLTDIAESSDWRKSIKSAIESSDAIVLVIGSLESAETSWSSYEVGMAEATGKKVIVVSAGSIPLSDLPEEFSSYQVQTMDPGAPEKTARHVVESLRPAA